MSGQNELKQIDWVDIFTKEGLVPKAKCWHEYEKGKKLINEYLAEALADQPDNEYDRAIKILIDYLEV